jgi:flagellar assembly protein FliH
MGSVIKASGPNRAADGMSFNFQDMHLQADQYLHGIHAQAEQILKAATTEAEKIRRQAEHQGHQAAIRAVERVMEEKVGKQVASLIPALRSAVDGIRDLQQSRLEAWEKSAVHVACQIAGRVIRREVAKEPQITLELVREALEMAAGSPQIVLRLHPSDHATLGPHVQQLASEIGRVGNSEVVADQSITPGSCRVDTRYGSIDQQFEAQLARIEEELT